MVPAREFLKTFASDRSHMRREDGTWLAPPPNYPPIKTEQASNNIRTFISMKPDEGVGSVLDEAGLLLQFGAKD